MWKREKKLPSCTNEKASDDLIRLVDMVKIYDTGSIKVLGLKRINLPLSGESLWRSWVSPVPENLP